LLDGVTAVRTGLGLSPDLAPAVALPCAVGLPLAWLLASALRERYPGTLLRAAD
jgi:hypothetical protein